MPWETELITLYFLVLQNSATIFCESERMSGNSSPKFTDAELMTIYLYCTKEGYHKKCQMHKYVRKHLLSWFPNLPSYQAFSYRLNRLESAFRSLCNQLLETFPSLDWQYEAGYKKEAVVDSLPIMLSQGNGCEKAKIALEIADRGYCSTKKVWYHGLKCHLLGLIRPHKMPQPANMVLSAASENDGTVFFQQIAPLVPNFIVYGDKAYDHPQSVLHAKQTLNLTFIAIQKRGKAQPKICAARNFFNHAISRIRQPAESAFNWLIQHTDIQNASKCRSTKGTLLHIFGKIATAFCIFAFFNA
jgi:hypothetical protein